MEPPASEAGNEPNENNVNEDISSSDGKGGTEARTDENAAEETTETDAEETTGSDNAAEETTGSDNGGENADENETETTASEAAEETNNDENADTKKKRAIPRKKILISIAAAVAVLAASYAGGAAFYLKHFFFNTEIGGVDCSNLTAEAAKAKIENEIDNYTFTFYEKDGSEEVITGDEINLTHTPVEGMEQLLTQQNAFLWLTSQKARELPLNTEVNYNNDALYNRITQMNFSAQTRKNMEGSVKNIYYENGVYGIHDDGGKDIVSVNDMYAKVKPKIKELYRGMSMEKEDCYKGLADDDMMKGVLNLLNKYVSAKITYKRGEESTVLDKETINKWLSVGDDYSVKIDAEKARAYVDELAKSYDTYGKDRKFTTTGGEVVTVSGGNYGWLVDNQKETEELCNIIRSGETVDREPVYKRTAAAHGPNNDLANTYVEISIGGQHLWYYKNGELIVSTDIVSGNTAKGNGTPSGTYYIAYKDKNVVLKGEDYETPVTFWMPFNGGIGLHDATWRGSFGGSIYRGGGSHGCVNLPYSAAQQIYTSISPGDPVVVY